MNWMDVAVEAVSLAANLLLLAGVLTIWAWWSTGKWWWNQL